MIGFDFLHRKWMTEPGYRKQYEALEEEFALIAPLAKATGHKLKIGLEPVRAGKKRKAG
jgi:hypothetical protein